MHAKVWEPRGQRFWWGNTTTPHPWRKNSPTLSGESSIFFDWACGFGRDAHGTKREERETFLASHISLINHVDQGNDVLPMDYPHIPLIGVSEKTHKFPNMACQMSMLHIAYFSGLILCHSPTGALYSQSWGTIVSSSNDHAFATVSRMSLFHFCILSTKYSSWCITSAPFSYIFDEFIVSLPPISSTLSHSMHLI